MFKAPPAECSSEFMHPTTRNAQCSGTVLEQFLNKKRFCSGHCLNSFRAQYCSGQGFFVHAHVGRLAGLWRALAARFVLALVCHGHKAKTRRLSSTAAGAEVSRQTPSPAGKHSVECRKFRTPSRRRSSGSLKPMFAVTQHCQRFLLLSLRASFIDCVLPESHSVDIAPPRLPGKQVHASGMQKAGEGSLRAKLRLISPAPVSCLDAPSTTETSGLAKSRRSFAIVD